MIEKIKIKDRIASFVNSSAFDPLIEIAKWYPLSNSSANYQTFKLIEVDANRMKFGPTAAGVFSPVLFMIFSMVLVSTGFFIGGHSFSDLFKIDNFDFESDLFINVFFLLMGLLMFFVGLLMYYYETMPRYFDLTSGYYWKGRKMPPMNKKKRFVKIKDIHAIQLLSKKMRTSRIDSDINLKYRSFELNLILVSGKRMHVICHGKHEAMLDDAGKISEFLNKPVWDAI